MKGMSRPGPMLVLVGIALGASALFFFSSPSKEEQLYRSMEQDARNGQREMQRDFQKYESRTGDFSTASHQGLLDERYNREIDEYKARADGLESQRTTFLCLTGLAGAAAIL